jgi:hypothetical protein
MRNYFSINGYWKDDKSEFEGCIVTNYDDHEEDSSYEEEDIFYYGLEERDLLLAIELGENTIEDFVIVSYEIL